MYDEMMMTPYMKFLRQASIDREQIDGLHLLSKELDMKKSVIALRHHSSTITWACISRFEIKPAIEPMMVATTMSEVNPITMVTTLSSPFEGLLMPMNCEDGEDKTIIAYYCYSIYLPY